MLNTTNYTRTLWSRDAGATPPGTNLYRNHPVYFDHRGAAGTHGVFFLNSNGMDIKTNNTAETGQYLEYNPLGRVFDFYFLAGPSPKEVAMQYAETVGHAAVMPYWGFGFHQCRYGMRDVYELAAVVANYSLANIPLEVRSGEAVTFGAALNILQTMWTDIGEEPSNYLWLVSRYCREADVHRLHAVSKSLYAGSAPLPAKSHATPCRVPA